MYKVNGKPVVILPSYAPLFITAGYKNTAYRTAHKMRHFALDLVSTSSFDVIAIGDGVVRMAGMEPEIPGKDGLWGVVGIKLDKFYRPNTKRVLQGVAQYDHMYMLYVKDGQCVKQGDVIGRCLSAADDPDNKYPGGHHLHFECSWNIYAPNKSPQVAGGRYIKRGVDCTVNPNTWLYIAPGQSVSIHPDATMVSASDLITRRVV